MKVNTSYKILLTVIGIIAIVSLLIWAFMARHGGFAAEKKEEHSEEAKPRVSAEAGETVITLTKEIREKSGIAVFRLAPVSHRQEIRAYGMVLQPQDLLELRNGYVAAKAQVEKARVALDTSLKEYERLKALHEENRNVSDKSLQAAEAVWRSDEAVANAAQEALSVVKETVGQRWGRVIAEWLFAGSPSFKRLVHQEDVLVQITLPSDAQVTAAPQTVLLETQNGKPATGSLVSPSPRTDPRIQGKSFFYMASAQATGLLPGMNTLAYLPVGSSVSGVVVPRAAVVWWQGKSWVFVQKGDEEFVRREISAETPLKEGFFVVKGIAAGDRVVVRGTQALLSEEFRSQIKVGEEGEEGEENEKAEKGEKHEKAERGEKRENHENGEKGEKHEKHEKGEKEEKHE